MSRICEFIQKTKEQSDKTELVPHYYKGTDHNTSLTNANRCLFCHMNALYRNLSVNHHYLL